MCFGNLRYPTLHLPTLSARGGLTFKGYNGILYPMKRKKQTRLAILRSQLGWTQQELGRRAGGLSSVYIKKLEAGGRPMSQRPAIAIGTASGVDAAWLMGRYRPYPILAGINAPASGSAAGLHKVQPRPGVSPVLMRSWSPDMAETLRGRRLDARAANEDAVRCLSCFLWDCHFLANIILTGYKAGKPALALARIHAAIGSLSSEFKAPGVQLPPRYENADVGRFAPSGADSVASTIVNELIRGLKAEIGKRPEAKAVRTRRG